MQKILRLFVTFLFQFSGISFAFSFSLGKPLFLSLNIEEESTCSLKKSAENHIQVSSPYVSPDQCIISNLASGQCLKFPASSEELKALDGKKVSFFCYLNLSPMESPIEWVDITEGVLTIYDYRWNNWPQCFDHVLKKVSQKHGKYISYFRTRKFMELNLSPEAKGEYGDVHDSKHSNHRGFFIQHNHVKFERKDWNYELFSDFISELQACQVPRQATEKLIREFKSQMQEETKQVELFLGS